VVRKLLSPAAMLNRTCMVPTYTLEEVTHSSTGVASEPLLAAVTSVQWYVKNVYCSNIHI